MRKMLFFVVLLALLSGSVASAALVDNGDGTVTDTVSGLMWQKETAPGEYTWKDALAYCETLSLAGHSDWRLPNKNELLSLVDYSRYNPAIDPLLALVTESFYYWSSATDVGSTESAWRVDFDDGYDGENSKSYSYYVRAVRAGQSGPFGHLVISKTGGGSGSVVSAPAGIDCGSSCSAIFSLSAPIKLTAQVDPGSTFTGWSGACQGTGSCQVTTTSDDVSVTASFSELGKITGRLTRESDGAPVAGVWVAAENYSTGAFGGGGCAKSDADGLYTITGLPAGDYRLEANTGGTDYALKYFTNAPSFAAASKVNVAISQTARADFQLSSLPAFKGDVNGDGKIDVADVILAIRVSAGAAADAMVHPSADVNGNGKIGAEEAVYDLQDIAQVRDILVHAPPKIDGMLAQGEWDDAKRAEITVEAGWVVNVFYKNDADFLYVAFSNLKTPSSERYPEILLDMNNDKSAAWTSDDWWFHTSFNNCEARGEFDRYETCKRAKVGWSGNLFPLDAPGTVEVRIEYEKLGLVSGEARDIGVAFDVTDTHTKWAFWPSSASLSNPSTWGTWRIE